MLFFLCSIGFAEPAIRSAKIHHSKTTAQKKMRTGGNFQVLWPFCASYPINICKKQHWVEIEFNLGVYMQRRKILKQSREDLKPLSDAFARYFREQNIQDEAHKIGHLHGAIQSIKYAYDSCLEHREDCSERMSTGWAEYPKFAVEMLLDMVRGG